MVPFCPSREYSARVGDGRWEEYLGRFERLLGAPISEFRVRQQIGCRGRSPLGPVRRCRRRGRLDDEQVPSARGGLRDQAPEHLAILERGDRRVDLRVLCVEVVGSPLRCVRPGQRPVNMALREHVSEPFPYVRLRLGSDLESSLRELRPQDINVRLNPESDELVPVNHLAPPLSLDDQPAREQVLDAGGDGAQRDFGLLGGVAIRAIDELRLDQQRQDGLHPALVRPPAPGQRLLGGSLPSTCTRRPGPARCALPARST